MDVAFGEESNTGAALGSRCFIFPGDVRLGLVFSSAVVARQARGKGTVRPPQRYADRHHSRTCKVGMRRRRSKSVDRQVHVIFEL